MAQTGTLHHTPDQPFTLLIVQDPVCRIWGQKFNITFSIMVFSVGDNLILGHSLLKRAK